MFLQFMTEISGLISSCLNVAAAAVLLAVEIQCVGVDFVTNDKTEPEARKFAQKR